MFSFWSNNISYLMSTLKHLPWFTTSIKDLKNVSSQIIDLVQAAPRGGGGGGVVEGYVNCIWLKACSKIIKKEVDWKMRNKVDHDTNSIVFYVIV